MDNSSLFKIVSPINVLRLRELTVNHPNRDFVNSVCVMFEEGAWPFADTEQDGYPSTNNESRPTPEDEGRASFLRDQVSTEVDKEHFSPAFGRELLPGMYSMPIFAVPKPQSADFHMVTDQSRGLHSLNSMVEHERVTGFPLDNLKHLGEMLIDLQRKFPSQKRVVWKSDVAEAYRLIPMHPL